MSGTVCPEQPFVPPQPSLQPRVLSLNTSKPGPQNELRTHTAPKQAGEEWGWGNGARAPANLDDRCPGVSEAGDP